MTGRSGKSVKYICFFLYVLICMFSIICKKKYNRFNRIVGLLTLIFFKPTL